MQVGDVEEHVVCMRKMRDAWRMLVGNSERKIKLGRPL
jgi:hypothetical protein